MNSIRIQSGQIRMLFILQKINLLLDRRRPFFDLENNFIDFNTEGSQEIEYDEDDAPF
ncbi:MAG: hypothetical protein JJU13_08570 [Balneolaceae bacterium]|nr:hypothetical protein [Balneolaceae bacterium]